MLVCGVYVLVCVFLCLRVVDGIVAIVVIGGGWLMLLSFVVVVCFFDCLFGCLLLLLLLPGCCCVLVIVGCWRLLVYVGCCCCCYEFLLFAVAVYCLLFGLRATGRRLNRDNQTRSRRAATRGTPMRTTAWRRCQSFGPLRKLKQGLWSCYCCSC